MEASATVAAGRLASERGVPADLALATRVNRRITWAMVLAHGLGALDLFVLMFWVLPAPEGVEPGDHLVPNLIGLAFYLPLSMAVGVVLGNKLSPDRYAWIREGRDPTPAEREQVLRTPLRCLPLDGGLWLGGLITFTAINLPHSTGLAVHVGSTILLGGLTTCAIAYLLLERLMRPITALALASGPPPSPVGPGVEGRILIAWLSATGVPLIGLIMLGCHIAVDDSVTRDEVARSVLVLAAAAFVVGLAVMAVSARTVSRPLTAVRRALSRVETGDLSAGVRVDDASEVGLLQTGFNRMVGGLREREHIQDLYARQVGEDVARAALDGDGDPRLGGSVHEVAVLFVDLVGSSRYALQAPPENVVARLNRFFAVIVEVIGAHGGWINKFEGDAALCVFGAPAELEDAAGCALAAGRDLCERLRVEMPGAEAGIGISAGPAVAGWVGAERRFEYTVIGDPVNEASRLCELAKTRPGRLLACDAIVARAGAEEREHWVLGDAAQLRGRPEPTRLAVPVGA